MKSIMRTICWSAFAVTLAATSIGTFALGGAVQWHPPGAMPIVANASPGYVEVAFVEPCAAAPTMAKTLTAMFVI